MIVVHHSNEKAGFSGFFQLKDSFMTEKYGKNRKII
jgi:hypothetical protein